MPRMLNPNREAWAVEFRTESLRSGSKRFLVRKVPGQLLPSLFRTRQDARKFAEEQLGYIRKRPDLQAEPHGWKPPRVVKVKIAIDVCQGEG